MYRSFGIALDRMHLLVYELEIYNPPVKNDLIQKLYHYIFCGLASKYQLENLVIKQVCILEIVRHKKQFKLNIGHYVPLKIMSSDLSPHHVPAKLQKILHQGKASMQNFLFFNESFSLFYVDVTFFMFRFV